ncbi:MAG: LytTR family DNA-binding domain-containing protein [Lachnospiraceae bacterium]|nr:LytTR family DNA-binding domain-containing protein [Ruminococcus sp.]MCM1276867.1 LytTR family DNA-binding domain-containing protein [Lachnospiraceae bacterium]
MIRAAVCDDEQMILDYLYKHISKEFGRQGTDTHIDKFTSGNDFLVAHKTKPFDVVFLDIDMPEISGFDVAERINGISEALIIFVTSHDELVFSSLKFRPFRFIRKTFIDDELAEVLEAVNKVISKRIAGKKFKLQTKSHEVYIDVEQIVYIEIYGHWLHVCTNDSDEAIECYGSLSDYEEQLEPFDFVRTHKSYLVNCRFIRSVEKDQIILDDKTSIPLSRRRINDVNDKFTKYLRSML